MTKSPINGQLVVSQVTVQVIWVDQGGKQSKKTETIPFAVVPRKGEIVFLVRQKKSFNVIDVIHHIGPNPPFVSVVLQGRA